MCMGLILLLTLGVGCGNSDSTVNEMVYETEIEPIEDQEDVYYLTANNFKDFFHIYFSVAEENLFYLNRNHSEVKAAWEDYKTYRDKILGTTEEPYLINVLSEDLVDQLEANLYLNEKISFPRKLWINDYITYGSAKVDNVELVSSKVLGEQTIYELAITTYNKVEPIKAFTEHYVWDESMGYYVSTEEAISPSDALERVGKHAPEIDSYVYAKGDTDTFKDEIKLVQNYWVTVSNGCIESLSKERIKLEEMSRVETEQETVALEAKLAKYLEIEGVKEASGLKAVEYRDRQVDQVSHVTRLPYAEAATASEKDVIKKVMQAMMNQSRDFYAYFEKALNSPFEIYQEVWKDMDVLNQVLIDEKAYTTAFSAQINPYKDGIVQMTMTDSSIQIIPSILGSKLQPRFNVTVPIKALLNNNEIVYYNYKYLIGMENTQIELIQFVNMETLTEDEYNVATEAEIEQQETSADQEEAIG